MNGQNKSPRKGSGAERQTEAASPDKETAAAADALSGSVKQTGDGGGEGAPSETGAPADGGAGLSPPGGESSKQNAPQDENTGRSERAEKPAAEGNPFEGYEVERGAAPVKRRAPLKPSKKIAYSAAATAIAVVAGIITVYVPFVRVMPLVLASFCFFIAFVRCGPIYGVITAAATTAVVFLTGGLSTSLILLSVCFFPYSILCTLLRRLDYTKVVSALIRIAAVVVFINLAFIPVYFIAKYVVLDGLDIMAAVGKAGYFAAALIISAVAAITDFLFVQCDAIISPKIK